MDGPLFPVDEYAGHHIEDLSVGMTAVFAKTITDADVVLFAGVSGDTNPVHLNEAFAARTMFKGRIAHGMLSASLISTVLGTKLPGPGCLYLSQNLRFKAPVRVGDTVVARVTVAEVTVEKHRALMHTECSVRGVPVIEGDAMVWVPSRAAATVAGRGGASTAR